MSDTTFKWSSRTPHRNTIWPPIKSKTVKKKWNRRSRWREEVIAERGERIWEVSKLLLWDFSVEMWSLLPTKHHCQWVWGGVCMCVLYSNIKGHTSWKRNWPPHLIKGSPSIPLSLVTPSFIPSLLFSSHQEVFPSVCHHLMQFLFFFYCKWTDLSAPNYHFFCFSSLSSSSSSFSSRWLCNTVFHKHSVC